MGAHFPAAELDNVIWFSTLSRISGFLWHGSKWACQFGCSLQYTSGTEVLPRSLDTNLNFVTTMLQLHPGYILKGRYYITPAVLSPDPRPSAEFSVKIHKFLRSLVEYLAALTFSCCHYIFGSYITCLTLSFNTLYVCFHSH